MTLDDDTPTKNFDKIKNNNMSSTSKQSLPIIIPSLSTDASKNKFY